MANERILPCEACGSEGRIYSGHPNDPHPRDEGPCPWCEGTGGEIIETEPVTLDDLKGPTYFCDSCDATCDPAKDPHCLGEFNTTLCENCREAAYDRHQERLMETGGGPSLLEQQREAYKIKRGSR